MCLGALRGEHSLKVARNARAVQRRPLRLVYDDAPKKELFHPYCFPFWGRMKLSDRQRQYNMYGFHGVHLEHLFAQLSQWKSDDHLLAVLLVLVRGLSVRLHLAPCSYPQGSSPCVHHAPVTLRPKACAMVYFASVAQRVHRPWGRTMRCAKSWLFSTTGSHGTQGPEFCTPCCFEVIMHASVGGWFSGSPGQTTS